MYSLSLIVLNFNREPRNQKKKATQQPTLAAQLPILWVIPGLSVK